METTEANTTMEPESEIQANGVPSRTMSTKYEIRRLDAPITANVFVFFSSRMLSPSEN